MKIITKLLLLILTCSVSMSMSRCYHDVVDNCGDGLTSQDSFKEADFIGAWKYTNDTEKIYLVLNTDGTGRLITVEIELKESIENSIMWYYKDRSLIVLYSKDKLNLFVNKLSTNLMVLTDDVEYTYSFIRIKKSDIPNYNPDDTDNPN